MATYRELAEKYSARYGVPLELVLSVMSQESQGKTNAVSPKGASGLMQLMPATAKSLGVTDIFDVEQNVEAGVKYLGQQLQEFGTTELALAAYNAGPGTVRKYNGIPPFAETQKYVSNIIGNRLPQAKQALQGKAYDLSGGKGVLDINAEVGGASSKAASPTASVTDALSASRQSLQQVQQLLAGGLPQADYEAASASSLNVLRGNLNNTRAALDVGQHRLEEQALMGNQQTQMLLDRYNQDPALATSRSSENAQALSDLQAGLLNTIKAKRAVANATLFSDPGTFMSSLLMGNPYARGQKDIEAEISALRNSNRAMTGTINDQRGLLTAATATPASTIMAGTEAQLRLAGLEKDVGLAEADAPVKISEAKTNALLAQVGAVREVASSATSLANVARAAAQSQEESNPLRLQAQEKQWQATIRTIDRQEQMQAAADAAVNPEEQAAYQAEADKLGTLAVLQQRRVEVAGGLPQAVGAANVYNAQAGTVQAASASKLAPLIAQTAEQLAAASAISAGTSVKQAGADAANFEAMQKLAALETEARINKLQLAIKIDKILDQNPNLDPALLAQLQQQSAILKEEALVKGLKVEQTGNVAGNVAAANVSNARAGAVQAASAAELAQLNAKTAGQSAEANYINSETAVKQAREDAANLEAVQELAALETKARTSKLQQAMKIDDILNQNPDLDPVSLAQLQQRAAMLRAESEVKGLEVQQAGNMAGNMAAANVSNARAGAVQAKSAEELAAFNAQTAGQSALANFINTRTAVKQADADAANFDAKQKLAAQELSIQTMQQQMKTMDTAAQLQAAPELVRLQTQYARDKAVFDANQQKEQLAQQDAVNRVASKQLTAAEAGLDQTAKASNKIQQAYLAAGGTGQLIEAQLSDGVKANLAKVADGQPAGANPVEATEVLNAAGALKGNAKYPELEATATKAQTLTQLYMEEAGLKIDEKTIKSVNGWQVADFAKLNNYARQNVDELNIRGNSSSNPYAMPDHRKMLAWATANNKLTDDVPAMRIATLPEEVAFDKIGSVDGMFHALRDSGQSIGDASTALASYFTLAIEYNNSNNGYELLGLRPADKGDFTVKGKSGKRLDLTTPAGIMSAQYSIASGFNLFR